MSLKENVSFIKDEISTEEQFFENFFKVEKFYNKYKKIIFGIVAFVTIGLIGFMVMSFMSEQKINTANEAYSKILINNSDKESLEALKDANEELYNIALFQITKGNESVKADFIEDIALYNQAVSKGDIVALNGMIMKQDFLLKDFAIISTSLIFIEKKDFKKAKEAIAKIDAKSRVLPLANMIKHFLLTK